MCGHNQILKAEVYLQINSAIIYDYSKVKW